MGESCEYKDLEELGIDDELTVEFTQAANHVQSIAGKLDNHLLLQLYGYYKQGLEGRCNVSKPSWYDMRGKSKWEAWNKLNEMSQSEAKSLYIKLVKEIDPDFKDSPKSNETWVRVSTLQSNKCTKSDSEKHLIDFIKEGNFEKVNKSLREYDKEELNSHVNALDEEGLGLIHWAADRGSSDILKVLVSNGAQINLRDMDGQTPLHYAASCGHVECIEYLLENGADVNVKDSEGIDCIEAASDDCVKTLLSNYKFPKE